MYEAFFGLRERPFDLTPDPRFLLMTPTHKEALANLQYGLTARKGLTVLIGEAGAGKTTLIRTALEQWERSGHRVAHLSNPTLTRAEFFEYLAGAFDMSREAGASKARFLSEFLSLVHDRHSMGAITGLVIDEAQSLSDKLLEEVRLLINAESSTEKLFQVLLVGQPELAERLNLPALRQIKQRIALRCTLATLDVRQVAGYISGRIQTAGGVPGQVFTREAVVTVHEHSAGIPRVINVICDNALLAAFAAGVRPVPSATVDEVCREFAIERVQAPGARAFESTPSQVIGAKRAEHVVSPLAAASPGKADRTTTDRPEPTGGGLFQHYVAAGKRRFSFF
jgi:general secretion pathway protein A